MQSFAVFAYFFIPVVLAPKIFGNAEVVEPEAIKSRDADYYSDLPSEFYSSSPPISTSLYTLKGLKYRLTLSSLYY